MAAGLDPDLENDAWGFIVALYHQPGVAGACLSLQDRLGMDVVMALFCMWLANRAGGSVPDGDLMSRAVETSHIWQEVIGSLRHARRALKRLPPSEATPLGLTPQSIREDIKGLERATERLELAVLVQLAAPLTQTARSAGGHRRQVAKCILDSYFSVSGLKLDGLGESEVALILDAAFT